AKALPDSVSGIDIVMGGKVAGPMKEVHQVGESYYINSGDRGRFVGLMQLHLNRDRDIDSVAVTIKALEAADPEDPYIKALVDEYKPEYDRRKKEQSPPPPPQKAKPTSQAQQLQTGDSPEQLNPLRSRSDGGPPTVSPPKRPSGPPAAPPKKRQN
ncbi:hypothetical protein H8D51_04520, partial [bacterium]|nr:hypothetical protein [bacterium]